MAAPATSLTAQRVGLHWVNANLMLPMAGCTAKNGIYNIDTSAVLPASINYTTSKNGGIQMLWTIKLKPVNPDFASFAISGGGDWSQFILALPGVFLKGAAEQTFRNTWNARKVQRPMQLVVQM